MAGRKVTDFPAYGSGKSNGLVGKGVNEPKRTDNLRAVQAHVSSVRAAAKAKAAPPVAGHGMLHGGTGPHPIAHLGNDGAGSGQKSREAEFRDAAVAK